MSMGPKRVVAMVLYVPRIVTFFIIHLQMPDSVDIDYYIVVYATLVLSLQHLQLRKAETLKEVQHGG